MTGERVPQLTITITTRNRAAFIGETLESLLPQLNDATEVLILDGASTDNTYEIVAQYQARCSQLRYVRTEDNAGPDRDFSRSVELSRGDYCWLMTDDDLFLPGAVSAVLQAIARAPSLVVVNAEVRNADFSELLEARRLPFVTDQTFSPGEWERFFIATASYLSFIGAVVIKRSVWLERDRETYYGSLFVHVGVIFQRRLPGATIVLAQPYLSIRYGNAKWQSRQFEIWMFKWPELLWSFASVSAEAKSVVSPERPWTQPSRLLFYRAKGAYSMYEYRRWVRPRARFWWERTLTMMILWVPGVVANTLAVVSCRLVRVRSGRGKSGPGPRLLDLKNSPYYLWNWFRSA